jgi:hypothetical protein
MRFPSVLELYITEWPPSRPDFKAVDILATRLSGVLITRHGHFSGAYLQILFRDQLISGTCNVKGSLVSMIRGFTG